MDEEEKLIGEILTKYRVKLTSKLNDYKVGTYLEATLLPVRVQGTLDTWNNKWFVFDGEKSVAILDLKDQCFDLYSLKAKKKKDK